MALGTPTLLTANSSTANTGATAPYSTAPISLTQGVAAFAVIQSADAASEEDATSVVCGSQSFTKWGTVVGWNTAAAPTRKLQIWYVIPSEAVATTAVDITTPDDCTAMAWVIFEVSGTADPPLVGTSVTNTAASGTSLAATHGALQSASNYLIGAWGVGENTASDAASGTGWTGAGIGAAAHASPNSALEVAVNVGGSATELTGTGAGDFARGMLVAEISAASVSGNLPEKMHHMRQQRAA